MNFKVFACLLLATLVPFLAIAHADDNPKDHPWADVTEATTGMTDLNQIRAVIDQKIPGFMNQLDEDAAAPDLMNLWGQSKNIDVSEPNDVIVHKNLLQLFSSILGTKYNDDYTQGHAGTTHTYGYLFSTLVTPYGFKRARYADGEIEAGFGLTAPYLNGRSDEGTLLSNLTALIAPIAFRDSQAAMDNFQSLLDFNEIMPADEITNYSFQKLTPKRVVEIAQNDTFYVQLRTDIVPFTHANNKGTDSALLIYSIDYHVFGKPSQPRLITAFPVQDSFAKGLFDPTQLGDKVQLQLKYNAALPIDLKPEQLIGKRYLYQ